MKQKTEEEMNDGQIPAELKAQLTEKVGKVIDNIGKIEVAVNTAIDDVVESNEYPITVTEIQAGLLNVMKSLNSKEIMEIVK